MRILFYHLEKLGRLNSGSGVRPTKIAQAFRESGHEVHIIDGALAERKTKIQSYKRKMDEEEFSFDLVYFENSSWPTSLRFTSLKGIFHLPDFSRRIFNRIANYRIPIFSFTDLVFFLKCKRKGATNTMFYRDIYWKYPDAFQSISLNRFLVLYIFSYIDTILYYFLFKKIFVPSMEMAQILPFYKRIEGKLDTLAPACQYVSQESKHQPKSGKLSLLYIGGMGPLYDPGLTIEALSKTPDVCFNLCTRQAEWEAFKESCGISVLPLNLAIHHLVGDELADIYSISDIAIHTAPPFGYIAFAMPVKIFEYFSNQLPVIAYSGTAYAKLIESENLGWVIDYRVEALVVLLKRLSISPQEIRRKKENVAHFSEENGWDSRVKKVISSYDDLLTESR